MDEMQEFRGDRDDPSQLRARIAADGYLLLRGLLDPDRTVATAQDIRRVLAEGRWLSAGTRTGSALRHVGAGREPADFFPMYGRVLGLESVNALAWSDRLVTLMTAVLGPTAFTFPMKTPRVMFPTDLTPPHRDGRPGPWMGDMFTTWVALDDISTELGGLAMLRGSQTYRHRAIPANGRAPAGGEQVPGLDSPDWVSTSFRAGDVVVFHCYTVHQSLPNRTRYVRVSVDYRWKAGGGAMHVGALMPHRYFNRYPDIPGWRTLTQEWSRRDWCGFPAGTEVRYDHGVKDGDDRVPRSTFVDVREDAREAYRKEVKESKAFFAPSELPPTFVEQPRWV